jgi:hypothetical protein
MRYSEISRSNVTISDRLLEEKRRANRRYLMSLDSDALLFNYRAEAALDNPFTMAFLYGPVFLAAQNAFVKGIMLTGLKD